MDGAFDEFRKAKTASDIKKAERLRENILAAKTSRTPPAGPKIVQMWRRPIDRVVAVRYDLVFK